MEPRELAEANAQFEQQQTLNNEPASVPQASEPEANIVENQPAAEPLPAEEQPAAEPQPAAKPHFAGLSKQELVAALQEAAAKPVAESREEVAAIKAAFYSIIKEEDAKAREEFAAAHEDSLDGYEPAHCPEEEQVAQLLGEIKEKRAALLAAQEAERAANLERKRAIINEINSITDDPDNINRQFQRVQQLQADFKAIGEVPATAATEVWKTFQLAVEKFYDLLKINKELRDYDFKKNLEIKQQLCAEAEALDDEPDVVAAFKKLQELHTKWRETGPVAKALREPLWARFKNASAVINKKHQAFFEERKGRERENAEAKTALCEEVEQVSTEGLNTYAAWDQATQIIIDLQERWRKLGFASRKVNNELFARFRKACDDFFAQKAAFFKKMKDELADNLARKIALCEEAESLQDSTEWRATAERLTELQKQWKTIGTVAKKHSDAVWKRFIAACDHFFDRRKKDASGTHNAEHENLRLKREIIAQLKAALDETDPEEGAELVRNLMAQWQQVGHVPYKEKDAIYDEYRAIVDQAFEKFPMRRGGEGRREPRGEGRREPRQSREPMSERDQLVRLYEARQAELKTYENNMGFLNFQSKGGNSLLGELERKVTRLREELAKLEQRIRDLDD